MTPDEAINKLDSEQCPLDCGPTVTLMDADEDGVTAYQTCPKEHNWPYDKFSDDPSTNSFTGEFDPVRIGEKLDEYADIGG